MIKGIRSSVRVARGLVAGSRQALKAQGTAKLADREGHHADWASSGPRARLIKFLARIWDWLQEDMGPGEGIDIG